LAQTFGTKMTSCRKIAEPHFLPVGNRFPALSIYFQMDQSVVIYFGLGKNGFPLFSLLTLSRLKLTKNKSYKQTANGSIENIFNHLKNRFGLNALSPNVKVNKQESDLRIVTFSHVYVYTSYFTYTFHDVFH